MANAYQLENFIEVLESWGLTDVMLPFLLIFTLIFAILEKSHLLGQEKRNLNTIIALVFALMVVIPHVTDSYPAGVDAVEIINEALPSLSIVIVAILMLLMLIGLFAHEKVFLGLTMPGWIGFISVIIILVIFGGAAGWWDSGFNGWLGDFFGEDAIALVIIILVFGIIIAFITGDSKKEEKLSSLQRMGIDFGKLFGK